MEHGACNNANLHVDFFFGAGYCLLSDIYWHVAEAPAFITKHVLVNSTDCDKTVILLSS